MEKSLPTIPAGLSTESEERQVSTLLYWMREGLGDILNMTGISDDDKIVYSPSSMPIFKFERTSFLKEHVLRKKQESGESAELYITAIHQMADKSGTASS